MCNYSHFTVALGCAFLFSGNALAADTLPESARVPYNNPGLIVDLGVGLWAVPMPLDADGDGDLDLVVCTADKPYNGIYVFENPGGDILDPIFKPARRIGDVAHNTIFSKHDGGWTVMTPGERHPEFLTKGISAGVPVGPEPWQPEEHTRAKQWREVDYDGDGALDLAIGFGVWEQYGWDNAYDTMGQWTKGPLHGYVYVALNSGTNADPAYADWQQVMTTDGPVDVYGAPSPCFRDWDGDGDLDLICGEFLDRLTYFENTGSRAKPVYTQGRFLRHNTEIIHMDLEMLQVSAADWDGDGHEDLIVGQEDGRVALMHNTGKFADGVPQFSLPRFFRQEADIVKIGALCTPVSVDWDGDGDEDVVSGDTAGYINFVENLGGGATPSWAAPVYLKAEGETIRIQAGPNGSIQGPAEAKWGYTVLDVADWNHDGRLDIVLNSIWGEILWYENVGEPNAPKLRSAQPVTVTWNGPTPKPAWFWWDPKPGQLVTQWRTSPVVRDLNGDGLNDLLILDQEGYFSLHARTRIDGALALMPPQRVLVDPEGAPLRLNEKIGGGSGRRKITMADWDGDGLQDILINSKSVDLMRCEKGADGKYYFAAPTRIDGRTLAGHTTCPTTTDWDGDGVRDLLIGAEDGFLYSMKNPRD